MTKRFKVLFIIIAITGIISGCAGIAARQDAGPAKPFIPNIYSSGSSRDLPAFVISEGRMAVLYITSDRRVAFRLGEGEVFLDEEMKDRGASAGAPFLYAEGSRIYAAWWSKTPPKGDKYLCFRVSSDGGKTFGPLKIINSGGGVINYWSVSDGKGGIAFVYDDERDYSTYPTYHVYINVSEDYGRTWFEKDVRLDSIPDVKYRGNFAVEPKVFINGQTIVVTWKERREEEGKPIYYLKSRTSKNGGKSWAGEVIVRKAETVFSSDNLISYNNALYLIGNENNTGVIGFRSRDNGETWEGIGAVPRTIFFAANSQIKVIASKDRLYAIFTADQHNAKSQVWFASYSPSENRWNEPVRMDVKDNDLTRALSPDILILRDGTLVAAWEDYRDIRSNIYMNLSADGGRTWQARPFAVEVRGRYNCKMPRLLADGDKLYVFFYRYGNDALQRPDYVYRDFRADKGIVVNAVKDNFTMSRAEKEKRLRKRVDEFWTLRVQGKYADTYDYYDPFYRAKVTKEDYTKFQGNILYHRFKIAGIDIQDNIATVKIDENFEVKEVEVMGMKVAAPPKDDTVEERWVWVYDDWYRVWENVFNQKFVEY
ncbi:MAG: hypothetical protein OHK0032_09420 [Thermodesulfovibrionales bacterium]